MTLAKIDHKKHYDKNKFGYILPVVGALKYLPQEQFQNGY